MSALIDTPVEQHLAVMTCRSRDCRWRATGSWQRAGEERRPILAGVVGGDEEEGLVLDDRPADGAGDLTQRIGNVHRTDGSEGGGCDAGGTDGGQKPLVENVLACMSPGRPR